MTGSPVVCLHGWCCDADHFNRQIDRFSGERRIVSIPWQADLLDHEGPVDLQIAAANVESFCVDANFDRPPILVGHSMGGMLAAMIARDANVPVGAIVVIDATWPLSSVSSELFQSFIPAMESDFKKAVRDFFMTRLISPLDDPKINTDIIDQVVQSDPEVGLAIFRDLQTPNRLPMAEDISVPIMGIGSSLEFLDRGILLEHAPYAWYGQIAGAGHFVMQQAPEQLDAMLSRFFRHHD